jgi:hypothetical protein
MMVAAVDRDSVSGRLGTELEVTRLGPAVRVLANFWQCARPDPQARGCCPGASTPEPGPSSSFKFPATRLGVSVTPAPAVTQ